MSTSSDTPTIQSLAKEAARLAKLEGDAMFVFDTKYGPHLSNVDGYLTGQFEGRAVLAVLPSGDVMNLTSKVGENDDA